MDFFCLSETESISSTRTGASGGASDEPRNKSQSPYRMNKGRRRRSFDVSNLKEDVLRMAKDVVQDAAEKSKSNDWCPKCKV